MAEESLIMEVQPPSTPLGDTIIYKGYRIELGSYAVGHGTWSPRAVVAVKTDAGAWQSTPLYSTSSAKFSTQSEADRRALEVATAWIDAHAEPSPAPRGKAAAC
jgi:hypothetical protein